MRARTVVAAATTENVVSATAPARFYRPELDGLRFLAFFGVFLHHALPHKADLYVAKGFPSPLAEVAAAFVRAGGFGVDLFFVLSAFLITELLLREHELRGFVKVGAFLTRRVLRIWPLFYFFVALSLLADRMLLGHPGLTTTHLVAFLALAGNWACAFLGYPESVAAPLWSVSIEEQFYLAFPLVLARIGPGRLRGLAVSLLIFGAVSRALTVYVGTRHPAVWCSTFCRIDTIGLGILLAVELRRLRTWTPRPATRLLLATAGLFLWIAAELTVPAVEQTLVGVSTGYPMVYVGAAGMLLAASGSGQSLLASRPFVALGRISYGLYVYHVLAITLAGAALRSADGTGAGKTGAIVVLAFGLTVVLAMASYRFLEAPFLMLKKRFTVVPSRD